MPAFFLGEHHEGQETNDQLLFHPRSTESGTVVRPDDGVSECVLSSVDQGPTE